VVLIGTSSVKHLEEDIGENNPEIAT